MIDNFSFFFWSFNSQWSMPTTYMHGVVSDKKKNGESIIPPLTS